MISLRENIYKVKFTDLIITRIVCIANENDQVAGQRGRITGQVDNLLRGNLDQTSERPRGDAGSRRVEHHKIGFFMPMLKESFYRCRPQVGRSGAAFPKIGFEIAGRGDIRLHGNEALESLRERRAEEAHTCEEIECQPPSSFSDDGVHKFIHEETVHLKKREVADAVAELSDAIADISRPGQLKAIRASIVEDEGVDRRQHGAEVRSHLIEGASGCVYRDIQEKPGICLVGERLDLAQACRQFAGSQQTYDSAEDLIQARRGDRALLNGAEFL
jgi:hypothetical protein